MLLAAAQGMAHAQHVFLEIGGQDRFGALSMNLGSAFGTSAGGGGDTVGGDGGGEGTGPVRNQFHLRQRTNDLSSL